MAISTDAIRRITIQGSHQGVTEAEAALNKLAAAQGNVAVVSEASAKRQLSAKDAYDRQTLSVVAGAREQANYEKAVRTAKSAMDQGVISATQYAARVDILKDKYAQGSASAKAFAAATSGVSGQLIALSAGAGPVGVFLSALGPWGIAAAAGVGLLGMAFAEANRTAQLLVKEADVLQNQSEITGWSTAQLQALTMETAKHGVSTEQAMTAVVKFTAAWGDARDGSGEMLEQLRKIDPALAQQMQRTKDSASALDLLVQAMRKADAAGDTSARIRLGRAAGGRGGVVAFNGMAAAIGEAGSFTALTQQAQDAGKIIGDKLLKEVDNLKDELDETKKRADLLFGSMGAKPLLEAELAWQKVRLSIAAVAIEMENANSKIPEWRRMMGEGIPYSGNDPESIYQREEAAKRNGPTFAERFAPSNGSLKPYVQPGGANDNLTTAAQLKGMKEQIALLGSAATASERYQLRLLELKAAVEANNTAETSAAAARGASIAGIEHRNQLLQSNTGALGSAATVTEQYTARVSALNVELAKGNITQETFNRAVAGFQQDQQLQQMRDRVSALGVLATETDDYRLRQAELKQQLDQGRISQETYNQALLAASPIFRDLKSATDGFGQSLLSNLMSGKSGFESLTSAASQYTQKMASATLTRVQNGGSLFGNQNLMSGQGALGMASAGLSGYQSGSPLGGALGGAMAGAAFGPAGMAIGGAVGLIGGLMGKAEKAKKEMEEARDAWAKMAGEVRKFTDQMTGTNTGALGGAITDATEKAQKYADAAHKAGEASTALNAALIVFVQRVTRDFIVSFDVMIEAMNQGLGADSPAVKAGQNIKQLGDTLKAFIDDTVHAGQGLAQASPAIAAAREASQQYVLSLLQVTPTLSETQTAILTLRGTAAQLQTTLQDLGMSADDAGQAIASGIGTAMDGIATKLTDGLNRQMNEATGKGYINQLDDLIKATLGNLTDADLTGVDTSLVAKLFKQRAQGIVDDAGLVGEEFTDLTAIFPELNGVLGQSQKALTDFSKNIDDFLNGLKIGDLSTLSPEQQLAAAQTTYQTALAGARGGDPAAQGKVTDAANTLLTVAKSYFASSGGYTNIFSQVTSELGALSDIAKTGLDTNEALGSVDVNTGQTAKTLSVLRGIQGLTAQSSIDISDAVQRLGEQGDYTANGQNSIYFGPMRDYLAAIEANTRLSGEAADQGPGGADAWYEDWFSRGGIVGRHATGGIIGAYAPGGVVGNGLFGKDSVLARYAGGGHIALAGQEGILTSQATQAIGGAQMIDFINRNDRLPEMTAAMPVIAPRVAMPANDNRGRDDNRRNSMEVGRMISAAVAAQTETLQGELAALRAEFSRQTATIRQEANRKVVVAGKK